MSFLPGSNTANISSCANWNGKNGNTTTVGTNGGPSYYGTYDQNGNVYEWVENTVYTLGGSYNFGEPSWPGYMSDPSDSSFLIGFRIASSSNYLRLNNFVQVGDVNNAPNGVGGPGSISYLYYIGKYLVTNCEYVDFLNAIAKEDTYVLYNEDMAIGVNGGGRIVRSGVSGSYSYRSIDNTDNKPVSHISWYSAARYCNWFHNGKPKGQQNSGTTEDGAYTLNSTTTNNWTIRISRNNNAKYWIPSYDEWYKAAYYKGGSANAGYWAYATQSNTKPSCVTADSQGNGIINGITQITSYKCPCNHKIVKLYIPGTLLSPGGIRATSIQLKIQGASGCCGPSNTISINIPPAPPLPPSPPPNVCIDGGRDLYGHTATVSYDPINCSAGHSCNRAIFDFYIDNYFIGTADLNNANDGGYRSSTFGITEHIIADGSTTLELKCKLSVCHQGIGRVEIKDPSGTTVYASCLPNDTTVALLC